MAKKVFKSKLFWVVIILVIAGVSYFVFKDKNNDTVEYVTAQVERGKLIQTVSATGKIESASETNLNFKIGGTLSEIKVKAGDKVEAGQMLAKLESSQASSEVASARAQVAQANADLTSIKAGSSDEEISVTEARVSQANADLAAAKESLIHANKEKEQNMLSYKEQALNTVSNAIFTGKEALEDVDEIVNEENYQDEFNVSYTAYNQAKDSYIYSNNDIKSLDSSFNNYSIDNSVAEIVNLVDQVDTVLDSVYNATDLTFEILSKVSAGGSLTQTLINSYKSSISTDQASLSSEFSSLQTARSNLLTKSVQYDNAIETAESNIEKYQAALDVAKAELKLKQSGPRDFQINLYEAKLLQSQANLQKALANLADYELKAPIEGVISKIDYEVGEYVSSANSIITLIGESNLEIDLDVPESDIAKINVGDEAEITLDAFGDEDKFVGHITFIDPAETVINDVVYYKVKITFDNKEEGVKSGMTANVIVTTSERDNVLYIPSRAVLVNGERLVRVLENGFLTEKQVVTGLRGDDGLIEVLSGLEEGETVVTYIKEDK